MAFKFKSFANQCIRVWRLLKKPTRQEYSLVSKVSAIGILALGVIGFIIGLVMRVF